MRVSRFARFTVVMSLALFVGGCGDDGAESEGRPNDRPDSETVGRFVFAGPECAYEGPATLSAGQATFALESRDGTADFDLWRIDDGHEYAELEAHIAEEVRLMEEALPPLGHPTFAALVAEASTDDQGAGTLTASLDAGEYGMVCIRFGEDGAFVAAGPFTVA